MLPRKKRSTNFVGFSLIFTIFALLQHIKSKIWCLWLCHLVLTMWYYSSRNCPRGIMAKLGDFQLIFCGFSVIFTIFALIKHIKSKIWCLWLCYLVLTMWYYYFYQIVLTVFKVNQTGQRWQNYPVSRLKTGTRAVNYYPGTHFDFNFVQF